MPHYGFTGQLGIGEETTFGTPATIGTFMEYLSSSLKLEKQNIFTPGIRGTASRQKLQYVEGRRGVTGSVVLPFYAKGDGKWLKHALGAVASVQQGATPAWLHTFSLAEALPTGLTIEEQKGDAQFHKFQGCKVARLSLESEIDQVLRMTADILGQDEAIAATGATATYPTTANQELMIFHQGVLTIGGTARNIRRFRVVIDNMLADDDFAHGSKVRQSIPRRGREITGEFLQAYDTASAYDAVTQYTAFRNFTSAALVLTFTGLQIDPAPHNNQLTITLPVVYYDGTTPEVGGAEQEVQLPVPFKAFKDTSDELSITLKNTETSI